MSALVGDGPAVKVLLVEDDGAVRDAVSVALTEDGYEVTAIQNGGTDFAAVLTHFQPDIAILDVYLPDGPDGFALAAAVEEADSPPSATTPARRRSAGSFPITRKRPIRRPTSPTASSTGAHFPSASPSFKTST